MSLIINIQWFRSEIKRNSFWSKVKLNICELFSADVIHFNLIKFKFVLVFFYGDNAGVELILRLFIHSNLGYIDPHWLFPHRLIPTRWIVSICDNVFKSTLVWSRFTWIDGAHIRWNTFLMHYLFNNYFYLFNFK